MSDDWKGPGEKPHEYSPDYQAMGDCRVCGHTREAHYQYAGDAQSRHSPTGRLSSPDPNLQNIPIRTEEGRRIRDGFVGPMPPPSRTLLPLFMAFLSREVSLTITRTESLLARAMAGGMSRERFSEIVTEAGEHAKSGGWGSPHQILEELERRVVDELNNQKLTHITITIKRDLP